jgi:hypothetical protein
MALTQDLVDEFVAAVKVVPRPQAIVWRRPALDLLRWDAQTEVEDVIRGRLWLSFSLADGRYSFNLQLQGSPVFGWHFRPFPGKHRNNKCGEDFPASVGYPHEQVWIEGRGFHCARPLEGVSGMSHEQHLEAFCKRALIDFRPTYTQPVMAEQTVMRFEADE